MDIVNFFKGLYYRAEDKWYDFLDAIDRRQIPIYKIIDPIDRVVPSFLLFLLIVIFILVLIAYLLQFYSPIEVTFVAVDSSTQATLAGVAISGEINQNEFSKVTGSNGQATLVIKGKPANLFEKIGSLFFAKNEEILAVISAEKSGYTKIQNEEYKLDSKEAKIKLTKLAGPGGGGGKETFSSSTEVELLDNATGGRIVDSTGTAFVKYNCANKGISMKTSSDNHDGVIDGKFKLIEPNCSFVVKGAYSEGYNRLDGINMELDPNESLHAVRLSKISNPTKGTVKIYVYEENSTPQVPLSNIQIRLLDLSGSSMEEGTTNLSGIMEKEVEPGTYVITAVSPDGNYRALYSDKNELIVARLDSLTEKTIYLKKVDPLTNRVLKIQVLDYNGRTPLKDVALFTQRLVVNSDGNKDAMDQIGACINSCKTDSNGRIIVTGLNADDQDKIVVTLFKEEYISKVFLPQLFQSSSSEYQVVELEKADYDPDTGNSGKGLVRVKTKNEPRGIGSIITYMYFNSSELNINGINLFPAGIRTDSNGEALFSGLRNTTLKNYYAKAIFSVNLNGKSQNKSIGIGETVIFDINIDTDESYFDVALEGIENTSVNNKDKAVVTMTQVGVTSSTPQVETLTYNNSTQTFRSKLHEKGASYLITVNLDGYVSNKVTSQLLITGRNAVKVIMYSDNNDISIILRGLFEASTSQEPANFLDLGHELGGATKGYFAKLDVVVGKALKDGNILAALRLIDQNAPMQITSVTATQEYLKQTEIYSCTPLEKTPYNDDNYYIQPGNCVKSDNTLGKQLGVMWDGNVASMVYNVTARLEFTPDANNGDKLDLNYSAKQNDINYVSEDKNRKTYEIGASMCVVSERNPTCPGLFFYSKLNNVSLESEKFTYEPEKKRFLQRNVKPEIEKDYANPFSIGIFNNYPVSLDWNITLYAYSQSMDSFNENTSGVFHFDSNSGPQKKWVGSGTRLKPFERSVPVDVNIFTTGEKVETYIVAVAQLSNGAKYFLFLNVASKGRNMFLEGGNFASGIPNQVFRAFVLNADEQPVELSEIKWQVLGYCIDGNILEEGTGSIDTTVTNYFSMTIPGVYEYEKDCLALRVTAKDPIYRELNKTLMAGTGGIDDPELGCATIGIIDSPNGNDAYLQWGNLNKVIIRNSCKEDIKLQFESRLILNDVDKCDELLPEETCEFFIKAQNSDYSENVKFSDVLGVFPVYIRGKLASSKKNFSQVKMIKVHVVNSAKCFSISKDTFDLKKNPEQTGFVVNNVCQYTDFKDYFIPRATLELSGVDLNDAKPKYDYIKFDYNINVTGGSYALQTNQILRSNIKLDNAASVMDHPSEIVTGSTLKKYKSFKSTIAQKMNAYSNHMMFRWTDTSDNEFYGAKIDGPVKIEYYDRAAVTITPSINFDFSSGIIKCTGADAANPQNHCIDNGIEQVPNGNDASMRFGLFYLYYPYGKVKSIEYDVIGDGDPSILIVYTNIFVDYNEEQTVPVVSGETVTNTIASGQFTILPIDNMAFLLRNYSNPKVTEDIQNEAKLCKLFLTNKAWVSDGNVYWIQKHYNNHAGASAYCTSVNNRLFEDNDNFGMVESLSSIPQSVIDGWANNQEQFAWLGAGYGFWTNECTDTTCKAISKTEAGFSNTLVDVDKFDVDSYVPFCRQEKPASVNVSNESCTALGITCDAITGVCAETTPELFDSFVSSGFIEVLNPTTSIEITHAETNNIDLNNSTVMIWIEGGILKAMFKGEDYAGYNDQTIELNIIDKDNGVVGDLYGTLNIVDYVNRK